MSLQQDAGRLETRILHRFADFAGGRILEIGCGEGRLTWQYAGTARTVIAFDPDLDALRLARADRPAGLETIVQLTCADSERIPFAKETFDRAVLAWSF